MVVGRGTGGIVRVRHPLADARHVGVVLAFAHLGALLLGRLDAVDPTYCEADVQLAAGDARAAAAQLVVRTLG